MNFKSLLFLAGLGLTVGIATAAFQPVPGYMDADAYYAVGRQVALGQGLTEPYLWNYLNDPAGIPAPSNAYWMPLASFLAAAGAKLFAPSSFEAARAGFLLVAACLPPLTAALCWQLTSRRELAFAAGLLAVFPAFYLPFLTVTDTFGVYMLFGGLFFLIVSWAMNKKTTLSLLVLAFSLGILSGLMNFSRTDGLIWLLMAVLAVAFVLAMDWPVWRVEPRRSVLGHLSIAISGFFLVIMGYLLIMVPWFERNISMFGAPFSPGGSRMFWLTSYDQLFAYPASQLTVSSWWASGLATILQARLWSLGVNLATALGVQWEVFLFPLVILGFWALRSNKVVQLAGLGWLLTLGLMTVIFPFAGARGGFFHSGAALQIVWWVLSLVGLERLIAWGVKKRNWNPSQAGTVFRAGVIAVAAVITLVIIWTRVIGGTSGQGWASENNSYTRINKFLVAQGASCSDTVMVANPPGYFLASGASAIAVPNEDLVTVLSVAARYNAIYLVLEGGSLPAALSDVYNHPQASSGLTYLGSVGNAHIFKLPHH